MSDIDILNEMIKKTAKISPKKDKHGLKVTLTEPQQPDSSITIHGLPNNSIIIKVDKFKSPDTIFDCESDECKRFGVCKRSDFVIITNTNNKQVILHIEMKAANGKSEEYIIKQLKGADCFIAYCRKIGQEFWDKKDFLKGYNPRFVAIVHTRINKGRTQAERKSGTHSRPKDMLKINSSHRIEFNKLAGILY